MKSLCIKTNNIKIKNYLLNNISNINFSDIYYTNKKFKIYENIIIHYTGNDTYSFIDIISELLANCILFYYEPLLIKQCIEYNYFYFDDFEKNIIEDISHLYLQDLKSSENNHIVNRKDKVKACIIKYLLENKSMILKGFVNFRLKDYYSIIDEIADYSVNKYIIEKEYNEFINLLKLYIESKSPNCKLLHLVYINEESILLDEAKNIISLEDSTLNSKYISDISFSSNDYALNALLTLLPEKLEIHIIDAEDEFINTLKMIFTTRVIICKDCSICRTYKILNDVK